jgi:hypothetical protein
MLHPSFVSPPWQRELWDLLFPRAEDADVGGVHDADREPGNSGGVVGEAPGSVGTVPG